MDDRPNVLWAQTLCVRRRTVDKILIVSTLLPAHGAFTDGPSAEARVVEKDAKTWGNSCTRRAVRTRWRARYGRRAQRGTW